MFIFTVVSISTLVFKVIQSAGPELTNSRYYFENIIFIQSLKNMLGEGVKVRRDMKRTLQRSTTSRSTLFFCLKILYHLR